ncbi:MAG: hypothetical protein U9N42_00515 [Campylobacterota bacterium]|nr:hypothetical protein [Campylobacterota bacterium]
MLAIPIDSKSSTTISKSFEESPFFALLDESTGYFSVVKNNGCTEEFSSAILYCDNKNEYEKCKSKDITIYSAENKKCSIDEIYMKIINNSLQELN